MTERPWGKISEILYELCKKEPHLMFQVIKVNDKGDRIPSRNIKSDELRVLGEDNELNISASGKWVMKSQELFPSLNQVRGLRNTIILDIDAENRDEAKQRMESTLEKLKTDGLKGIVVVDTGSKGYHIAVQFIGLKELNNHNREEVKEYFIQKYGGESGKGRDSAPISLDVIFHSGELRINHWKTNKPVTLIEQIDGVNNAADLIEEWQKKKPKCEVSEVLMLLIRGKKTEATEAIVEDILYREHIFTTRDDKMSEMWIYRGGIYVPQARTYIQEHCRSILGEAYTTNLANQVLAKIEADTYIDPQTFFEEEEVKLIAIQNGVFNVLTKELEGFSPEYKFFNKLPVKYVEGSDCPEIKKFFSETLPTKSDIDAMQEFFGYLLWKRYNFKKAVMLVGVGDNGKTVVINLMKHFLGTVNCSNLSLEDMQRDIYSVSCCFKKMANLCGDISKTALKNTGPFKMLTGNDEMEVARKYLARIKFTNYAKMVFSANELPLTYDDSEGYWTRWLPFVFPYQFKKQNELDPENQDIKLRDPNLLDKLTTDEEISGLLNWAVEGLQRLFENKDFSKSPTNDEIKTLWLRKTDSCEAFLMDCVNEEYESMIEKGEFRQAYKDYCKEHRLRMSSDKIIKNVLARHGIVDGRSSKNGKQVYSWEGIKFKHELEEASQDSGDSYGFSTYKKKRKFPIESKKVATQTTLTKDQILASVQVLDAGEGADTTELESAVNMAPDKFERTLQSMKTCGDLFEIRPGRVKVNNG